VRLEQPTLTIDEWRQMAGGRGRRGKKGQAGKSRGVQQLPKVLESDIRAAIKEFLELNGWLVWINWQGPFSFKGLTDLTAIRGGEVWWIEVKRPGEPLRPEQERFRELMEEHCGNWLLAEKVEDVEHLARR